MVSQSMLREDWFIAGSRGLMLQAQVVQVGARLKHLGKRPDRKKIAHCFAGWGIPTALCLAEVKLHSLI